ncbi:MAG: glycosyltransferase family 39 protein [Bacteroidetes bacterium]|nr:glycosyltransferase family 39 protein [Bacteroidota bacterium]
MIHYLQEKPRVFLVITLALNIILHLPFIHLPPCSIHVWRQCNTLAVARNFHEEDDNILKPRVDRRFDTDGVTGMQFPAYEWILSKIYFLTGEHYYVHRLFSLLLTTAGLLAAAGFFRLLTGNPFFGALAAWVICWSPELFYHGINALPDILAFSAAFSALYFTYKWITKVNNASLLLAFIFITLAGLVKIQYGLFGIFMAVSLFKKSRNPLVSSASIMKHWLLPGILSLAIICGWYIYANRLIDASGLQDFVINIRPVTDPEVIFATIQRNIISDFPELLLNYSNFIFFILGSILLISATSIKRFYASPFFVAGLVFLVWYFMMLEQMRVHQYYLLPALLITTFIILKGIRFCLERKYHLVAWVFILIQPALASIRIIPARWMKADLGIPAQFADSEKLQQLIEVVPANDLVITGPDNSGCIWLYFLHKKGFSFENSKEFFEKENKGTTAYKEAVKRGGQWLYIRKGEIIDPSHPPSGVELQKSIGDFEIYKVIQ